MESLNFTELQSRIQNLNQEGEYITALDLATRSFELFPDKRALLYYWRITLLAHLGNTAQSLKLLQEALQSGLWYNDALLQASPSLEQLRGMPEFENLIDLNQELRLQEYNQTYPLLALRPEGECLAGGNPCPLLLGLHANGGSAHGSMGFWKPAGTAGWLVAAPQSTQAMWKGAYVWDDRQMLEGEIKRHYATLVKGYSVDTERVVLAGHAMGAEIALWLALSAAIPARGVIAVEPNGSFLEDLKDWQALIQSEPFRYLRAYLILGEDENSTSLKPMELLVEMLNSADIPCELEILPKIVGNFIAEEYEDSLLLALDYVVE